MSKELDKEIEKVLREGALSWNISYSDMCSIAEHFYELGCRRTAEKADEIEYNRQRAEESVPKDLEEAAETFFGTLEGKEAWSYGPDHYDCSDVNNAFIAGAKWQKEQDEKEQADLFTIVALDAAQRAKEQMMKDYPKWRRIKAGERLPCPAYVWTIAYDNYPDCFEGRLMPNIQGVKVGQDTWYLPVDVIHNLPKEDEK